MSFKRITPSYLLKHIIECYWIVENTDPTPVQEKIIPDGFPEMIFHYGDPYRIRLSDQWVVQSRSLYSGQITKYFYLENTGKSGVMGVKLKPTAITHLYNQSAHTYTDKVVDLLQIGEPTLDSLERELHSLTEADKMIALLNEYFLPLASRYKENAADKAIELIVAATGMISIADICSTLFISERQLERVFKKYVGLSPKFYCRIIRFNHIFHCMERGAHGWSDVVHNAGYYDQSHFIRNFKAFTGEEPSAYLFEKTNLANFFLKKKDAM